jgi:hypothetical protein
VQNALGAASPLVTLPLTGERVLAALSGDSAPSRSPG